MPTPADQIRRVTGQKPRSIAVVGTRHIHATTPVLPQKFLLGAGVLVDIPIALVLLSRILKHRLNRWMNITAGLIMTAVQVLTLLPAQPTLSDVFRWVEMATTALIIWFA